MITWLLVDGSNQVVSRFYGFYKEAEKYFSETNLFSNYPENGFEIVSLSSYLLE